MKRVTLTIVFALICGFVFTSCGKGTDVNEIEGTYVGTYTTTTRDFSWTTTPTIELKNGKYTYKGLSNDCFHSRGLGTFIIKDNKITFELTGSYHDPEAPMVDFMLVSWFNGWLLNGEYKYKFDGNKLIFSKTYTDNKEKIKFEFELQKKPY